MNEKELEANQVKFTGIYKKHNETLHRCPTCKAHTFIDYYPGKRAIIYCPNGCQILTLDKKAGQSEEDFIVAGVRAWNGGQYDR